MDAVRATVLRLCLAFCLPAMMTGEGMERVRAAQGKVIVKGLVVGPAAKPVAGARVTALRISESEPLDPFSPVLDVETDSGGRFQGELRPGTYCANVTKGLLTISDDAPSDAGWWKLDSAKTVKEVRIPLRKGGRVRGIVVRKQDGAPVPSAKVVLGHGMATRSDANGGFEIEGVGFGGHCIMVCAPGLADAYIDINTTHQDCYEVHVQMHPGYRLRGKVTDEDGRPIAAALVQDHYSGSWVHCCMRQCLTDKDGTYELGNYSFRRKLWSMGVSHPEFASSSRSGLSPPEQGDVLALDFVLGQGYAVEGHVFGADGQPVKDAKVSYGFSTFGVDYACTNTDEKGFFRLAKLAGDREESIVVQAKGYAPAHQKAKPGKGAAAPRITFKLAPGPSPEDEPKGEPVQGSKRGRASGRVVDSEGHPISGATVYPRMAVGGQCHPEYIGESVTTDKKGCFKLDDLPAAGAMADIVAQGYSDLREHPLALDKENTVVMQPRGFIVGKVVDENTGQPVTRFNVRLGFPESECRPGEPSASFSAHFSGRGQYCSSKDGAFTVSDLIFGAPHAVIVVAEGYAPTRTDRVVTQAAHWKGWPVVIKLGKGSAISGSVLDAQSEKPVEGAEVFLLVSSRPFRSPFRMEALEEPERYAFFMSAKARTDSTGGFQFTAVGQGAQVLLLARHPQYAPALLGHATPATPGVIKLASGGSIVGSAKDVGRLDAKKARVSLGGGDFEFGATPLNPDNTFQINNLPAGEYEVTLLEDWEPKRTLSVRVVSGQTTQVELARLPGFKVRGRVTLGGAAVAGARMRLKSHLDDSSLGRDVTDAEGRYEIASVPPGEHVLEAEKGEWTDFARADKVFKIADRDETVDLVFSSHSGRIVGRILHAGTGKLLADASVCANRLWEPHETSFPNWIIEPFNLRTACFESYEAWGRTPRALGLRATRRLTPLRYEARPSGTGAAPSGLFEVVHLAPGRYFLTYSGGDDFGVPNFLSAVTVEHESHTQQVELRYDRSAALTLKIVDADTKRGIPDAAIHLHSAEGFYLTSQVLRPFKPDEKAKTPAACAGETCLPDGR